MATERAMITYEGDRDFKEYSELIREQCLHVKFYNISRKHSGERFYESLRQCFHF